MNLVFAGYIYLFWILCRFQHCTGHITQSTHNHHCSLSIDLFIYLGFYVAFNTVQVTYHKVPIAIIVVSISIYLFIWGFTSLSTLYRSYHDG